MQGVIELEFRCLVERSRERYAVSRTCPALPSMCTFTLLAEVHTAQTPAHCRCHSAFPAHKHVYIVQRPTLLVTHISIAEDSHHSFTPSSHDHVANYCFARTESVLQRLHQGGRSEDCAGRTAARASAGLEDFVAAVAVRSRSV